VYVDLARAFDPGYAVRCGIRLDSVLIARPDDVSDGLDILRVVAAEGGASVVALDSTTEALARPDGAVLLNAALRKLSSALRQTGCTALLLSPGPSPHIAASGLALRLHVENVGWIEQERDVSGLRARVTVVKNQWSRAGQQVEIAMALDDRAQEDAA
jgi:RecA/RadA recombinase